ncbi:uncharacterized protein Z520_09482 [Fonsecaea multimorphosa CBS 102226]|uniref:ATP-dependent RNA helicase n=1 Tax=Fonsecaea multimorphosa CBS 102226 TaxID=1442371 RepID=A0A0D2JN60_9EURO|nr:uncharacterized protein Z520_09482 [Fonsecaea multimorphosa CBS 102226]KIX94792.1 hypothetical protein Z520_09482 [Fonsecaea multimorphosa CBS 102226]OAL20372.1 hypothetical protein AYO22_08866 [Fonsecaea multimorphosa]
MSGFYARYVPATTSSTGTADNAEKPVSNGDKRKRDQDAAIHEKRRKKLKSSKTPDQPIDTSPLPVPKKATVAVEDSSDVTGKAILDKYRIAEAAGSETTSATVEAKASNELQRVNLNSDDGNQRAHDSLTQKKKEKRRKTGEQKEEEANVAAYPQKHTALLTKYEKARQQDQIETKVDTALDEPPPELHGLEPIPQPKQIEVVPEKPTYSTLPPWQENPLTVPLDSTSSFESLGIQEPLLGNLKRQNLRHALPIQASVLPLLLDGADHHPGDLCVSAATGSGKTLSYVLPIVADLKDIPGTKLRAVIVVPTRELVKQVRDLCDICAAGTSLKFATAVGSKSLTEEQDLLVKEEKIFNPEEYEQWQQSPIDWANFSLSRLAQNVKDADPMESAGYVTRYKSKVDVLITTPGRLVDHLKSTSGFTLDDLKWLVVDEADRLLNESYQEWIAVVKPTLESRAATAGRDQILRHMRMTLPRRNVIKVLLSATMTRDLSKLNSVGLWNPKLVVLGGNPEKSRVDRVGAPPERLEELTHKDSEVVYLPGTLRETVIPVTNGAEKPLYLLQLLHSHIALSQKPLGSDGSVGRPSPKSDAGFNSSSSSQSSEDERDSSTDTESHSREGSTAPSLGAKKAPESHKTTRAPRALIFTRSTASATRLSRLLCIIDPLLAPGISTLTRSTASSASSRRALASFRKSKISVLIATDRASRGLDVPGLEHVISYDVPNSPLTYVHRVGRTARAGRAGHAWTFVEHREAAWFWREIGGKVKHATPGTGVDAVSIHRQTKISKLNLSVEGVDIKKRYEAALQQLEKEVLGK